MKVTGVRFVQGRNRYGTTKKYAVAIHATANTAPATNEAAYATRRTDGTSSHFYADAVEVIQSLDTNDKAGHAGSWQGNDNAIAVEITGTNSWSRAKWLASVNWNALGKALAAVCKAHAIPVVRVSVAQMAANAQVKGFYDHNQMRQAWGQTDHTDPGANFPWDHLLAAVKAAGGSAPTPNPTPTPGNGGDLDMDANEVFDAVWHRDQLKNPYGDAATNKTIYPETALFNIGNHTEATMVEVRALRADMVARDEADKVRDAANAAAVKGLVDAIGKLTSGGGSVEAAPIIAAVNAVGAEAKTKFAELQTALAAQKAESDRLRAKLAEAAKAEADALAKS